MDASIRPYTHEEYAAHLRVGTEACLVCGLTPLVGEWTDYNGQIRCHGCGTTYQTIGCKVLPSFLAKLGLAEADVRVPYCDTFVEVPLLRAYHAATGRRVPWGMYFGDSPVPRKDIEAFYGWIAANADRIRPDWDDFFDWDAMLARFAVSDPAAGPR